MFFLHCLSSHRYSIKNKKKKKVILSLLIDLDLQVYVDLLSSTYQCKELFLKEWMKIADWQNWSSCDLLYKSLNKSLHYAFENARLLKSFKFKKDWLKYRICLLPISCFRSHLICDYFVFDFSPRKINSLMLLVIFSDSCGCLNVIFIGPIFTFVTTDTNLRGILDRFLE